MDNIVFDHGAAAVFESLGVSKERNLELKETIEYLLYEEGVTSFSIVIERCLELFKPKNTAETIWIGISIMHLI